MPIRQKRRDAGLTPQRGSRQCL
eukprot:gene9615-biopygen7373